MVNIFYPKKKQFSVKSSDTQSVFNSFPSCSISIYDDPEFSYKRQSVNGAQILSNIISDDLYPQSESLDDKSKYETGLGLESKLFYAKILVNKNITQDLIDDYSNVFTLTKTQNFGKPSTIHYPIRCIQKNALYTEYMAVISLLNSDFANSFDGKIYFNLYGEYNFVITNPINIDISDFASTSLAQISSPTTGVISSKPNTRQFFTPDNKTFKYIEYSNNFDYNYQVASINLTSSLFSTASTIFSAEPSGVYIRFTFSGDEIIDNLEYFGLTFINNTLSYEPAEDTVFRLIFVDNNGQKVALENCTILQNATSGYYDVIFTLSSARSFTGALNYVIVEIQSRRLLSSTYDITFMYFLKRLSSAQSFSVMSNKLNTLSIFSYDLKNNRINDEDIKEGTIIKSSDLFNRADNFITVYNEICYQIKTASFEVTLPEYCSILTNVGYRLINSLSQYITLQTVSGSESIVSLKIKPPRESKIIDVKYNSDYALNGFYIKNPVYIKTLSRKILPQENHTNKSFFFIDKKKYFFSEYKDLGFYDMNIVLNANDAHEFDIKGKNNIQILLYCEDSVLIKAKNTQKTNPGRQIITVADPKFTLKSQKPITIIRLIAS